jgi:molecular chaperone GrpE
MKRGRTFLRSTDRPGEAAAQAAAGKDSPAPAAAAPAQQQAPATGTEAAPALAPAAAAPPKAPAPDETAPLKDQLLRLQADFDNFRKRTLRERGETAALANQDLMLQMLPVLDHLDLALAAAAAHKTDDGVVQGFRLVADQLLAALARAGLEPVDAAPGGAFDPAVHEAVSHLPSPDVPENAVVTQARRGYKLGGRMLRAVQAVVSSGPPKQQEAAAPAPAGAQGG